MKKTFLTFIPLVLTLCLLVTSCTEYNAGYSFVAESNGITYQYEVITSRMNYVRISPVSDSQAVTGDVTIPATVNHEGTRFVVSQIKENAFRNYTLITAIALPPSISSIENSAFKNCTSLSSINTPQPLSIIGAYAFENCYSLEAFDFEASISSLGEGCFKGCTSLTTAVFPSSFTAVPNQAFLGCTSLTTINLPATIMNIGNDAFGNCTNATAITFGSSVQTIGERAFENCSSVQSITITTPMPPTCYASTFNGVPNNIPVTVPMPHVTDYQNATGWNHFTNYVGTY